MRQSIIAAVILASASTFAFAQNGATATSGSASDPTGSPTSASTTAETGMMNSSEKGQVEREAFGQDEQCFRYVGCAS
jgi:hypothetical protein